MCHRRSSAHAVVHHASTDASIMHDYTRYQTSVHATELKASRVMSNCSNILSFHFALINHKSPMFLNTCAHRTQGLPTLYTKHWHTSEKGIRAYANSHRCTCMNDMRVKRQQWNATVRTKTALHQPAIGSGLPEADER